jgi:class 3 adenylate cyclase
MDRNPRFDVLRQSADAEIAGAIETMVTAATDSALSRIDALRFAREHGFREEPVIDAFVHAARLGLFEMSWNLLCPGCGGVLDAGSTLKEMRDEYNCSLCAGSYEPTLDEMVEVSFTVSPAVRRIAAHDPNSMPLQDYYRDLYFSNSLVLPKGSEYDALWRTFTLEAEEVPPGEKVILSVRLPAEFVILFEPMTHRATFLDVKGEPTRERRDLTVVYNDSGVSTTTQSIAPGPLRLTLVNRTNHRVLPGLFNAGSEFHSLFEQKQGFLTAKRLFTNQTFRDLYRTETLSVDQRLKIASLTVLFTDLKGSTELYERVGDLAAYDLVRQHFRVLADVVKSESGAVVKTIGDAVMATFPTAQFGVSAALQMRRAMDDLNASRKHEDLLVKIGLHEGPCLAVISNDRLDYFGQTVNIAARVQGLATDRSIFVTQSIVENEPVRDILSLRGLTPTPRRALLRGMADELTVYEIP